MGVEAPVRSLTEQARVANAPTAGSARLFYGVTTLVALAAACWVIVATRAWGLGVSPDSMAYLVTAEQISEGWGIVPHGDPTRLATPHYPPLYPMVLAALRTVNDDLRAAARWLHVALAAVNVLLIALLGARAAGRAGGVVAAFVGLNGAVLEAHAWLLSEPLALTFTLAGLILLADALALDATHGRRRRLLLWAALATGAACLTRYASLALLASGVLGIIVAARDRRRQGLIDAATFAVIGIAPLALWVVRNRFLADTTVNRRLAWFGFDRHHLGQLEDTAARWFALRPSGVVEALVAVLLAAAGAWITALILRRGATRDGVPENARDGAAEGAPRRVDFARVRNNVLLPFIVCYAALVAVTVAFLDRSTPLDARILLPLQVPLVVLLVSMAIDLLAPRRRWHAPAVAALLFLVTIGFGRSVALGRELAAGGHGFSARWWAESQTVRHVATLPSWTVLYSNAPEVLYVHLGRHAHLLPRAYDADGARRMRWEGATIVWFSRYRRGGTLQAEEEFVRRMGLIRTARLKDGAVYRMAPATRPTTNAVQRK